jgi:monothiol glutaredoxin
MHRPGNGGNGESCGGLRRRAKVAPDRLLTPSRASLNSWGMEAGVRDRIARLVGQHAVVLFMKGSPENPACGFSAKAVQILDALLPEYQAVDVLRDPELRDGIKAYSNWPTIPQLYVAGEFVGGSDIMAALYESGELEEKLGALAAAPAPRITLSDAAATELRAAIEEPGEAVRLDVSPRFEHDLAVGVPDPRDIIVEASGVRIAITRGSARRANGMHIDIVETPDGVAFKIDNPNEPPRVKRMTVRELRQRLEAANPLLLIDVRTPAEREIASISAARPWDEALERELEAMPRERPIVVYCHHGGRSARAAEELVGAGFRDVYNLSGGIDAWSVEVDPSVPRY